MLFDIDYLLLQDDKVMIVDQFTGVLLEGRRLLRWVAPSYEAKKALTDSNESKNNGKHFTFQNFFRMTKNWLEWPEQLKTEEGRVPWDLQY